LLFVSFFVEDCDFFFETDIFFKGECRGDEGGHMYGNGMMIKGYYFIYIIGKKNSLRSLPVGFLSHVFYMIPYKPTRSTENLQDHPVGFQLIL